MQLTTRLPGRVVAAVALGVALLGGYAAMRAIPAAATAPCIAHGNSGDEQEFLQIHQAWRHQYVPGSDFSNPLQVSATLNASAMAYARFLADTPGAAGPGADGADWATRAVLCGYPADLAVGGAGMSLVVNPASPVSAQQALNSMTATGVSATLPPANLNGLPMRCIGVAHAISGNGSRDAWVVVIAAGSGACPQQVLVQAATPTIGAPRTSTPTPRPTSTPRATPTATPTPQVYRLRMHVVASDGE